MSGRASRTKGHSFEREVARSLTRLDPTAKRNVAECQTASVDIITELPLAIQCKCLARWGITPHNIMEQAKGGRLKPTDIPVGIVRISHKKGDLAILYYEDFLNLIEKIYAKTNQDNSDNSRSISRPVLPETKNTLEES